MDKTVEYEVIIRVSNVLVKPEELKKVFEHLMESFSKYSPWPTKVIDVKELV